MSEKRDSGWFDKFAGWVGQEVARAWFFTACVLMVILWVPTIFFMSFDKSQLLINTSTTIITFLMVAVLQNTQDRTTRALHHKLDALLEASAEILDQTDGLDESGDLATRLRDIAHVEMEASPD